MAVLSGPEIARQVALGGVVIDPFDPARCGPNSYDLTLAPDLLVYAKNGPLHAAYSTLGRVPDWLAMRPEPLDMAVDEVTVPLTIPPAGLTLWPGVLYLGATVERAGSDEFVPCLSGRSSAGRMGLGVHVTAGFGDCGWKDRWTMEITVVVPLIVYPHTRVCQVYFNTVVGERKPYRGKYTGQTGPRASALWKDFGKAKGAD